MKNYENDFCVIGAGAAGIVVGKMLKQNNVNFSIIECSSVFGGNWAYDSQSSKMYESVHIISSKLNTELSDYPMPDDYPVYPNYKKFLEYLRYLAREFGLDKHAEFNRKVVNISPANGKWDVTFCNSEVRRYGDVVVCNGLLREPIWPDIPGKFSGVIKHAGEYRSPELFKGKRVLIVGAGNSGCDIAVDASGVADKIFHSTRRGYHYMPKFIDGMPTSEWMMKISSTFESEQSYWEHVQKTFKMSGFSGPDYGLPEPDHEIYAAHPIINSQILYHYGHGDITAKVNLKSLDGNSVEFIDGSKEEVDVIVYATGYKVSIPFIDKNIVNWENGLSHLFLNMIPEQYDNLLFVGYVNSPAGFGNISNTASKFMTAYINARKKNSLAWRTFNELKKQWNKIDVGRSRFVAGKRHDHEVDLWKYLKLVNFLTAKLRKEDQAEYEGV